MSIRIDQSNAMKVYNSFQLFSLWILNFLLIGISQKEPSYTENQKAIIDKFGLANVTRKDAVPDLINYIEEQKKLALEYTKKKSIHSQHKHESEVSLTQVTSKDHLPICKITYRSSIHKGSFQYNKSITKPRYDEDCYLRRVRYHSAPVCQEEDRLKGLVPLYTFEWKMEQAKDKSTSKNLCQMPNTNILHAAAAYLKHQANAPEGLRSTIDSQTAKYKEEKGKAVNIVFLGLSTMGQTFASLSCLNQKDIDIENSNAAAGPPKWETVSMKDIVGNNNGHCTGYSQEHIKDWFPTHLHPNYTLPVQNVPSCATDAGFLTFQDKTSTTLPKVRACYTYTFNLPKNFKQGGKLPCGLEWEDVDIVFALHSRVEFFDYLFRRSNANENLLKHLKIVSIGEIYEALVVTSIQAEQKEKNMKVYGSDDMQAKPQHCKNVDSHYSMPGIPDYAIDVWLSIMATGGFQEVPNEKCRGPNSIHDKSCQLAQIGEVKFFGR